MQKAFVVLLLPYLSNHPCNSVNSLIVSHETPPNDFKTIILSIFTNIL
ncbi:hypothetical protein CHCC14559_4529 [Bacillus licheniformis]|nr:hypothetical protein CHCC14562_2746 [Bacillus licheniformis]TWN20116.1 hypothetical protein CHCC14559_4529 [Bacillus licheniformis]